MVKKEGLEWCAGWFQGLRKFFIELSWRRKAGLLACVLIVAGYFSIYLHYRFRKEIVHFKTWSGSVNHHRVRASFYEGRLLFVNAVMASENEDGSIDEVEMDRFITEADRTLTKRTVILSWIFAPARIAETCFWYLADFRRDDE